MMKKRVVVTGLGAVTPVGNDIPIFWQAIIVGKSGVGKITQFDASKFDSQISAEVKGFDPLKYFSTKVVKKQFIRHSGGIRLW